METRVGSGRHTYEVHDDWMRLPPEVDVLAASVTVDSHDNVYCFSRSKEHPVVVFDREGNFVRSWGAGCSRFRIRYAPMRTTTCGSSIATTVR